MPAGVPSSAAEAARDTLGGAQAVAEQLPEPLGAELLDAAREAFTHGLQLTAATSAAVAAALAILAAFLLRRVPASAQPPDPGSQPMVNGGEDLPGGDEAMLASADRPGDRRPSLSSYRVSASIAVSDMAQATEFYEAKLGLSGGEHPHDGSRVYACGGGTALHVYRSPTHAGAPTATLATWRVADLEAVVDQLRSQGVNFERYDAPQLAADDKGIHTLADGKVAWFKDADGNTFAVEQ